MEGAALGCEQFVIRRNLAGHRIPTHAAEGGVLIRDLHPAVGNPGHGSVTWTTPWAYKVEKGEIVGRYPRFVLKGAVIEMLNKVVALGKERRWIGAAALPDLVLERVG